MVLFERLRKVDPEASGYPIGDIDGRAWDLCVLDLFDVVVEACGDTVPYGNPGQCSSERGLRVDVNVQSTGALLGRGPILRDF